MGKDDKNDDREPNPDDPPEVFYRPLGGRAGERPLIRRASVKEVFRDRRREQEFYIRVHISPRAAALLVLLLTLVSRIVEGIVELAYRLA